MHRRHHRSHRDSTVLTRRDELRDVYGSLARDHDFLRSRRDVPAGLTGATGKIVEAAEIAVGAGAVGVLAGRLQTWSIPGTPVPMGLALGLAGHAIDALGFAGSYGDHITNLSNGFIAGWATMVGASKGRQMREKAGQPIGDITAGSADSMGCGVGCGPEMVSAPRAFAAPVPGWARPSPLTEAEIMAARARR